MGLGLVMDLGLHKDLRLGLYSARGIRFRVKVRVECILYVNLRVRLKLV